MATPDPRVLANRLLDVAHGPLYRLVIPAHYTPMIVANRSVRVWDESVDADAHTALRKERQA